MSIKEFVENILKTKSNEKQKFSFGTISKEEVEMLKNATGLDLTDYQRTIDNYCIQHAFNKHGNQNREEKQGQIAINSSDFEKIPEITSKPDNIITGEKDAIGNDLIKFEKEIENKFIYAEEVRKGKKELACKTMYKRKKKKDV
jgi:hypothetical protein